MAVPLAVEPTHTAKQDEYGALGPVLRLGQRVVPVGLALGLLVGVSTHAAGSARALALGDIRHWWRDSRIAMNPFLSSYDVDVSDPEPPQDKPEEKPPEPEEPEPKDPEPKDPQAQPKPQEEDPYKNDPPPKPAEAAKMVTAPEGGQAPLDDFDTQSGEDPNAGIGGKTSKDGSGKKIVTNPAASLTGSPSGTGTGPAGPPKATGPDLSKPPTLSGSTSWNCPFPAEADAEGRDSAVATIVVTVRVDGTPQSVSVVSDPGAGFGRAARQCALGRRYQPALDRAGAPTVGTTPPIRVRFSR